MCTMNVLQNGWRPGCEQLLSTLSLAGQDVPDWLDDQPMKILRVDGADLLHRLKHRASGPTQNV